MKGSIMIKKPGSVSRAEWICDWVCLATASGKPGATA
jgi:hypothetical protein